MANIPDPQIDLPRTGLGFLYSGGWDFWDEGLAGEIVTDEYFEEVVAGNTMWVKVSGVWKQGTLFVRTGGIWKTGEPKVKDSGIWK